MKNAFIASISIVGLAFSTPASSEKPKPPMPTSNPAVWINHSDFRDTPYDSVRGSVISFRLTVSNQGQATDCAILQSSGSPQVDAAACKALVGRAQFKPGRDAQGNPAGGIYYSRIHLS